jgi:hypothetical protein
MDEVETAENATAGVKPVSDIIKSKGKKKQFSTTSLFHTPIGDKPTLTTSSHFGFGSNLDEDDVDQVLEDSRRSLGSLTQRIKQARSAQDTEKNTSDGAPLPKIRKMHSSTVDSRESDQYQALYDKILSLESKVSSFNDIQPQQAQSKPQQGLVAVPPAMWEAMLTGQVSTAQKKFARSLLSQEDEEVEDRTKVEYSAVQLENFHSSIAGSILELRAAMVQQ